MVIGRGRCFGFLGLNQKIKIKMGEEMITGIVGAIIAILFYVFGKQKEKAVNASRVPEGIARWLQTVRAWSNQYGVPFDVAMAVLWVESAGDENARGSSGEYGLYQLKPIAVLDLEQMGFGSFPGWKYDPEQNIKAGIAFLALQKKRTGTWEKAIKAYNQGQAGAERYPDRAQVYFDKVKQKRRFF